VAKYFVPVGSDRWRILDDLRDLVRFTAVNLVEPASTRAHGSFDVIFCRNVLIYFDDASRRVAAENLYDALVPGGYICLGHTESMSRISPLFEVRRHADAIVYQRPTEGFPWLRGRASAFSWSTTRAWCASITGCAGACGLLPSTRRSTAGGLEKLLVRPVDLLVVDVNMPQMDGFTFLRFCVARSLPWRRSRRWSPARKRARGTSRPRAPQGANFYLVKPVPRDVLTAYAAMLCGDPA
jgi:CheY-like chemotaxis protein